MSRDGQRSRGRQTRGSCYITAEGFTALKQENQSLWARRRLVTAAVAAAAAEGDRSENAEYIYRKKQLREIDRRLRYLQKRLDELTVVERLPEDRQRVYFGAWITVADSDGRHSCYRIVGPDEFDHDSRYISVDSPVARALLKHSLDEEIRVSLPSGDKHLTILAISYEQPCQDCHSDRPQRQ
jgi:transcription elongation factor GreB